MLVCLSKSHHFSYTGGIFVPLTFDEVSKIVSIIDCSTCDELVVEADDLRLVVRRNSYATPIPQPSVAPKAAPDPGAAVAAQPAPAATAATVPVPTGMATVTAPMVGTFFGAPAPDKPAFVNEGALVAEGDPLCLIEVMKLFTTVYAPTAGRVKWVFPQDGTLVEFGQTLFVIAPA